MSSWNIEPPPQPPSAPPATPPRTGTVPQWTPPNPPPPLPGATQRPARGSGWKVATVFLAGFVVLLTSVIVGLLTSDGGSDTGAPVTLSPVAMPTDPPVTGQSAEPIAEVAEAVLPAVVQIQSRLGLGSGTVYHADGLIMTNAHVVEGADEVTVTMADGTRVQGEVLGSDEAVDVAVVRIDPDAVIEVAVLALDEEVRVGQLAVALGSPFGFEQTVTAGIVSAVDRPFPTDEITVGMIQTDAPINSGNSGGALADRQGRVIGVPTAIFSTSGDNTGIGFAIPIDLAYAQAQKIVAGEPLVAPFLGVLGEEPGDGSAGALIIDVSAGSAAEAAGLRVGDVVRQVDGAEVRSFGDLASDIGAHSPGDRVALEIDRGGTTMEIVVELGSR